MKNIFLRLFLCLFLYFSYSQDNKIQKLTLSDSLVYNTVENFIKERKKVYPKFNTYGYIILRLVSYDENYSAEKPLVVYKIIDQYYSLDSGLQPYPNNYTYISDKLVLIYDNWSKLMDDSSVSKRCKRKIRKRINKTLEEQQHLYFKDKNGKVILDDKNFRPDTSFNIHGGILLSIYADGKHEINTAYNNGYK